LAQDLSIARAYFDRIDGKSAANLLIDASLTLHREGNIQVCYSPFDHVEMSARLVIVGITPGKTQAVNALNALCGAKQAGKSIEEALNIAKKTASFSGAMRSNLVEMLDCIGVARLLKLTTTASLFERDSTDMHFTSALRYPVFVDGENYSGTPSMLKVDALTRMVDTHLAEEARMLPNALWLPLGPKAEEAVSHLATQGLLPRLNILTGMPHPSGANAERIAIFTGRKSPDHASAKTNSEKLLRSADQLKNQISNLGVSA
jgi:hypothetical protein